MKWHHAFAVLILAGPLGVVGCDEANDLEVDSPVQTDGVEINVDANEPPRESRVEARQERREKIREAIDDVDVNVGDGELGVDVNNDDDGIDINVD